ncbi:hypothetical protein FRC17_001059 [Serendipita sp. 399]|nr:hypothetical protein FRC17_001059 [Serendipita sp. 399]
MKDTRNSPQRPPPPIFRLPAEVLQDIFHRVAEKSSFIRNVRLTCRDWHDLVAADRALPRHIALRCGYDCKDDHQPDAKYLDYCVHGPKGLNRVLGYIEDAHFALHLQTHEQMSDKNWSTVPWDKFQLQCVQISIYPISTSYHPTIIDFLHTLPALHNLNYVHFWGNTSIFSSLMCHSSSHSNKLRTLELNWRPDSESISILTSCRHIFSNVKDLKWSLTEGYTSIGFLIALFGTFEALEALELDSDLTRPEDVEVIRRSVDWKFKPRTLTINATLFPAFPSLVLERLVILSLWLPTERGSVTGTNHQRISLPQLASLTLNNSWDGLFEIAAPKLKDLHLLGIHVQRDYFTQTQLLEPSFVELEGNKDTCEMFLSRVLFPNITELHLHIQKYWTRQVSALRPVLSFDDQKHHALKFPQLEHLLVIFHSSLTKHLEELRQGISSAIGERPRPITVRCLLEDELGV